MAKNSIEDKFDAVVTTIIEAIGASVIEQKLQVPARLQKARSEAFNEGYTARDKELQPLIRESEHERELLKNERLKLERQIASLNQQRAAKDQILSKLQLERDRLKAN
ncbi:MAG TPA: hypothetical protein VJZ68_05445 [Nitrososphaera sp.]|nr:hypothetical protein [Nitrososphaera sp.]